jgi:hypothetical protein
VSVKYLSVIIYTEPHGRRKRPMLESFDNDGDRSVEYNVTPEQVREWIAELGWERREVPAPPFTTIWKLQPLGYDGPIMERPPMPREPREIRA